MAHAEHAFERLGRRGQVAGFLGRMGQRLLDEDARLPAFSAALAMASTRVGPVRDGGGRDGRGGDGAGRAATGSVAAPPRRAATCASSSAGRTLSSASPSAALNATSGARPGMPGVTVSLLP